MVLAQLDPREADTLWVIHLRLVYYVALCVWLNSHDIFLLLLKKNAPKKGGCGRRGRSLEQYLCTPAPTPDRVARCPYSLISRFLTVAGLEKNISSDFCDQRSPRSTYVSDHCSRSHPLASTGKSRVQWSLLQSICVDTQADQSLRWPHIFKYGLSPDEVRAQYFQKSCLDNLCAQRTL